MTISVEVEIDVDNLSQNEQVNLLDALIEQLDVEDVIEQLSANCISAVTLLNIALEDMAEEEIDLFATRIVEGLAKHSPADAVLFVTGVSKHLKKVPNVVTFEDIAIGEEFSIEGSTYIRIPNVVGSQYTRNAIDCEGTACSIEDDTIVRRRV